MLQRVQGLGEEDGGLHLCTYRFVISANKRAYTQTLDRGTPSCEHRHIGTHRINITANSELTVVYICKHAHTFVCLGFWIPLHVPLVCARLACAQKQLRTICRSLRVWSDCGFPQQKWPFSRNTKAKVSTQICPLHIVTDDLDTIWDLWLALLSTLALGGAGKVEN